MKRYRGPILLYSKHARRYLYTIFVPQGNDEERREVEGCLGQQCFWFNLQIHPHRVRNVNARRITLHKFCLAFLYRMWSASLCASGSSLDWRKCRFYRREDLICQPQNSCSNWLHWLVTSVQYLKRSAWARGESWGLENRFGTVWEKYWKILVNPWTFRSCLSTSVKSVDIYQQFSNISTSIIIKHPDIIHISQEATFCLRDPHLGVFFFFSFFWQF